MITYSIEAERVAEALVSVFTRVGVPKQMFTDQGSQLTSEIMKQVCKLLSVHRLTTTPYHPMCNELVERFNGTLKQTMTILRELWTGEVSTTETKTTYQYIIDLRERG